VASINNVKLDIKKKSEKGKLDVTITHTIYFTKYEIYSNSCFVEQIILINAISGKTVGDSIINEQIIKANKAELHRKVKRLLPTNFISTFVTQQQLLVQIQLQPFAVKACTAQSNIIQLDNKQ